MTGTFREHLFPPDHPRLAGLDRLDPYQYADLMLADSHVGPILRDWRSQFEAGHAAGVTADGRVEEGLFRLGSDDQAPSAAAARAAQRLIAAVDHDSQARLCHPLDSRVWRAWMNPEVYLNQFGLRLEELSPTTRTLALDLVRVSVSQQGFDKIQAVMRTNDFLGQLVALPRLMNEFSYNINIFGHPSEDEPWGWNLYGHHLCLNSFFIGGQQTFTPVFFGAEPNTIDAGTHAGTRLLDRESTLGLEVLASLPPALRKRAVLFPEKRHADIPPGRMHPADDLHLGGAFQDARVIPPEGVRLTSCPEATASAVLELVRQHVGYLPPGPLAARLAEVHRFLPDTWFCWIGGSGPDDVFYYRLQSPVILIEFDHHAGVFLGNTEPERFHIHTLVRTPNAGDYGTALVRQALGAAHELTGPA